MHHDSFADDTQLQHSGHLTQLPDMMKTTHDCISDLKSWMTTNKLQLNDDKTELMLVTPKKRQKHTLLPQSMSVCNVTINFSLTGRDDLMSFLTILCVLNNTYLTSAG